MSTEKRTVGALMMLDMRSAETVDDEKIEAVTQGIATKGLKQAQLRGLTFEETCCAFIEAAARVLAAPLLAHGDADTRLPEVERLAARMGENLAARMIERAKGLAPGEDEIGETKGTA